MALFVSTKRFVKINYTNTRKDTGWKDHRPSAIVHSHGGDEVSTKSLLLILPLDSSTCESRSRSSQQPGAFPRLVDVA